MENNLRDVDFIGSSVMESEWYEELKNNSTELFLVGGAVRDFYLNKKSKDLDFVVSGLTYNEIINMLNKYGTAQLNKSGDIELVLFIDKNGEYYDICKPKGGTILTDLSLRDFTYNSMAFDLKQNVLINPYDGLDSIEDKKIYMVDTTIFEKDPIRILRCIGQSARFGFKIDRGLMSYMSKSAHKILECSPERVKTEFEKWFLKGDSEIGWNVFWGVGLDEILFDFIFNMSTYELKSEMYKCESIIDIFIYVFSRNCEIDKLCDFLKKYTFSETMIKIVKSFMKLEKISLINTELENRYLIQQAIQLMSGNVELFLEKVPFKLLRTIEQQKFIANFVENFPLVLKDLEIDGFILMENGFKGKEIGLMKKELMEKILKNHLKNDKAELLNYIKKIKKNVL